MVKSASASQTIGLPYSKKPTETTMCLQTLRQLR